jgi:hypothetical protein
MISDRSIRNHDAIDSTILEQERKTAAHLSSSAPARTVSHRRAYGKFQPFKSEWKEKGSCAGAKSSARASGRRIPAPFPLLIPSDAGLYNFDLMHFLYANRYRSSGQPRRGHASLEIAIRPSRQFRTDHLQLH